MEEYTWHLKIKRALKDPPTLILRKKDDYIIKKCFLLEAVFATRKPKQINSIISEVVDFYIEFPMDYRPKCYTLLLKNLSTERFAAHIDDFCSTLCTSIDKYYKTTYFSRLAISAARLLPRFEVVFARDFARNFVPADDSSEAKRKCTETFFVPDNSDLPYQHLYKHDADLGLSLSNLKVSIPELCSWCSAPPKAFVKNRSNLPIAYIYLRRLFYQAWSHVDDFDKLKLLPSSYAPVAAYKSKKNFNVFLTLALHYTSVVSREAYLGPGLTSLLLGNLDLESCANTDGTLKFFRVNDTLYYFPSCDENFALLSMTAEERESTYIESLHQQQRVEDEEEHDETLSLSQEIEAELAHT